MPNKQLTAWRNRAKKIAPKDLVLQHRIVLAFIVIYWQGKRDGLVSAKNIYAARAPRKKAGKLAAATFVSNNTRYLRATLASAKRSIT